MLLNIQWQAYYNPEEPFWYKLETLDDGECILMGVTKMAIKRVAERGDFSEWKDRYALRCDRPGVYECSGMPDFDTIVETCSPFKVADGSWSKNFGKAGTYGSADNIEQVLAAARTPEEWTFPGIEFLDINDPERMFAIEYIRIDKEDNSGWRWHKNGRYIGDHEPKCEYLGDEENIEFVLSYRIHELIQA